MWRFITETWTYDPGVINLGTALAILAAAGIVILIYARKTRRRLLQTLWAVGTVIIVIILVFYLAGDYYRWVDNWEGRVTTMYDREGWSLRTGAKATSHFFRIKLEGVGPEIEVTVPSATYSAVGVGDYAIKRKGSYWPEIHGQ